MFLFCRLANPIFLAFLPVDQKINLVSRYVGIASPLNDL